MRIRITKVGYAGLLVGLLAAALYFTGVVGAAPERPHEEEEEPSFVPTERIDVEQSVNFPYDI